MFYKKSLFFSVSIIALSFLLVFPAALRAQDTLPAEMQIIEVQPEPVTEPAINDMGEVKDSEPDSPLCGPDEECFLQPSGALEELRIKDEGANTIQKTDSRTTKRQWVRPSSLQ